MRRIKRAKLFDLNALKGRKQVTAFYLYYQLSASLPQLLVKTMKDMQDKLPADIKAKTGF